MTMQPLDGVSMEEEDPISIEIEAVNADLSIVHVKGRLSMSTKNQLRQRVAELVSENRVNLILDFSGVSFMDSSGLTSVLSAMRRVSESNGRICIVCDTRYILRVLRITAIDKLMAIYSTLEEAIAAFNERTQTESDEQQ